MTDIDWNKIFKRNIFLKYGIDDKEWLRKIKNLFKMRLPLEVDPFLAPFETPNGAKLTGIKYVYEFSDVELKKIFYRDRLTFFEGEFIELIPNNTISTKLNKGDALRILHIMDCGEFTSMYIVEDFGDYEALRHIFGESTSDVIIMYI